MNVRNFTVRHHAGMTSPQELPSDTSSPQLLAAGSAIHSTMPSTATCFNHLEL